MKKFASLLLAALALASASLVSAQPKPRVSPPATATATIDGADVSIAYSRPSLNHPKTGEARKIWGTLVPWDKVWRTGANEATILTVTQPIMIGDTTVPVGKYSLYSLPSEKGASKLIINKQTGQWGTVYDEKQDLARVDLKKTTLEKAVDPFTITVEKADAGGVIKFAWETTELSAPFTVKK